MLRAISPPVSFTQRPIDGFYWVSLVPYLIYVIKEAMTAYQTCPTYDGVVASKLPLFDGTSCAVFLTERILYTLWQNPYYQTEWHWVNRNSPTLSTTGEMALDRIMAYVDDLGLFRDQIPSVRRVIVEGVFTSVCNDITDPSQYLSPQRVVTTFSFQLFPTPTTTSYCPSVTVTYPYAISSPFSEVVVSTRGLTLSFKN